MLVGAGELTVQRTGIIAGSAQGDPMNRSYRTVAILAGVAGFGLLPAPPASATTPEPSFCNAYREIQRVFGSSDQPDPQALAAAMDAADASAPSDIAATIHRATATVRTVLANNFQDFAPMEAFDFTKATSDIDGWAFDHCTWPNKLSVEAHDYHFVGMPTQLTAGDYTILLTNHAEDAHELTIARMKAGETMSWADLLKLPGDQAREHLEIVAHASSSASGLFGFASATLTPGEYLVVCGIPFGTVTGPNGSHVGNGPPHYSEGMSQMLTVVP